jgi:hypothetical protein
MLENHSSDFLLILDCCYAGNAARGQNIGKNELLAASNADLPAWSGPMSFTKLLCQKLENLFPRPFNVSMLHRELATELQQLLTQPFTTQLGSSKLPSIQIYPLPTQSDRKLPALPKQKKLFRISADFDIDGEENFEPEEWLLWLHSNTPSHVKNVWFTVDQHHSKD